MFTFKIGYDEYNIHDFKMFKVTTSNLKSERFAYLICDNLFLISIHDKV